MAAHVFAAIDVGSFELELAIYEISAKNGINQIDHIRHVIALGKDTYKDGKISYELVEETCSIIKEFTMIMKSYKVKDYCAYATSAMREAKNNQIVLDQIRVRTGIDVKIISNSEQRFLNHKAIAAKKTGEFEKLIQKGTAIADIGFGSMQISLFDKDVLISTQNLRLGVLRIKETLSEMQTDTKSQYKIIEEVVDNELFTFRKMYLKEQNVKHIIACGEGILLLSHRGDGSSGPAKYTAAEFNELCEKLKTMSIDQMEEEFGITSDQTALLIPAAIIYRRILDLVGAQQIWIPGICLCDGIAAEYAQKKRIVKFGHNFDNDIIATARNISRRYKCHTSHTESIEKYVLNIFDCMLKYHGLGARERLLLQIATILHDCGKFISMKNPSECAYNIIISTELIGLSHAEQEIIANVVRYNMVEFDYGKMYLESAEIQSQDTILVAKLTAMLRLANAMDRSHEQKLKGCRISVNDKDKKLMISTEFEGNLMLEELSIRQKEKFFEEIFGIYPVLKQRKKK